LIEILIVLKIYEVKIISSSKYNNIINYYFQIACCLQSFHQVLFSNDLISCIGIILVV